MIQNKQALFEELEALGEHEVRERLAQGIYGKNKHSLIQEWLRSREDARAESKDTELTALTREANELAREANDIARLASRWAMYATIIATAALAIAAKDEILKLIF